MNKVLEMGRLTKDPDVRYSSDNNAIARFTLAVDRKFKKDGGQDADFINHVAFGKTAEFIERYVRKGTKVAIEGRIQTGSYEKDGQRIYTTDIVVEQIEFAESKGSSENTSKGSAENTSKSDDFMNIPDDIDEEVPWS